MSLVPLLDTRKDTDTYVASLPLREDRVAGLQWRLPEALRGALLIKKQGFTPTPVPLQFVC